MFLIVVSLKASMVRHGVLRIDLVSLSSMDVINSMFISTDLRTTLIIVSLSGDKPIPRMRLSK